MEFPFDFSERAFKERADVLQAEAKAEGRTLTRGHALDQAARENGCRDWNAASALAKRRAATIPSPPVLPDDVDEPVDYVLDDGKPPLPRSGVPQFDGLSEPEKIAGLREFCEFEGDARTAKLIESLVENPSRKMTGKSLARFEQAAAGSVEKCAMCERWVPLFTNMCAVCELEFG